MKKLMIVAAVASLVAAGCCKNCECGKPDCKCGCKDGKECVCAKTAAAAKAVEKTVGETPKKAEATDKQAKDAAAKAKKDAKKQTR